MRPNRTPAVLLQVANLLGGVANAMVSVLVPWLVLEQTGSPATAGLVGAVSGLPGVLIAPFMGAMVDRLGRRRVSVGSDVLSAVSVSLFPIVSVTTGLTEASIIAVAVLGAAFDPAGYTARKSLIPDVARAGRLDVERVNGIHEGVFAAGWVVGPALAAVGIATIGAIDSFWLTSAAFVAAVVAVAGIRVTEEIAQARAAAGEEHEPFWASSLRGLRVLWADRPLRVLTLAVAVLVMVYLPTEAVLLPTYFEDLGRPGAYGVTLTMIAAGAAIGSFSYGWLVRRMSRHRMTMVAMGAVTAAIIPMALLPPIPVFVTAGFLLGVGWGPLEPMLNSLVQTRVPAHVQGRVYGVQMSLFYAAPPTGMLVVGVAVEAWGVQAVYAAVGALLAGMALLTAALPSLRGLDRDPVAHP